MKKFGDSCESKENSGCGSGGDHKDERPKTLSPSTPPSSLVKMRKKKLKEIMHVKISSKKIEKPKSDIVTSDPTRKSARSKRVNSSSKTRAVIRAEEVLSSLNPKFPSCLKTMVRSHVSSCFWMGLSTEYCNSHLPKKDMMITVEDESGKEFQMKYFSARTGLSGGWRNFAIMHKLHEGDVLIFQLIEPLEPIKLKVHIVRDNDVKEEDGPLNLDENNQQNDAGKDGPEISQKAQSQHTTKRRRSKSLQCDVVQKKQPGFGKSVHETLQQTKKIKTSDQEPDLEIISDLSSSSSRVQFKDVKSFEDFTIMAEDLCIDSELPNDIRLKYYELCSAKKAFLHARLMQGLNCKLIAGIISETVNIADSIKTCSLTTCRGEYANWERALKSFHFLGMSVGFMLVRIRKLVALAFESDDAAESRKYMEAKLERVRAEDEMVSLKSKFVELKETFKKCGGDVKALKSKAEGYEHKFQEEVGAPW